jgi:hypothetical protein
MRYTDGSVSLSDGYTAHLGDSEAFLSGMSLRERSALVDVDKRLHEQWRLGQNVLLCWCPEPRGLAVLVVPHYAVAEYAAGHAAPPSGAVPPIDSMDYRHASEDFFKSLLSRDRMLTAAQLSKVARLLGIEITHIALRYPLSREPAQLRLVEHMVKRYGISYVPNRAVALFDIVGFSLLSPFEQMNQINSLAYSLNSAQSKLLTKRIDVNFARSTTGDGFYIWNRDLSLDANVNLYQFMHLVLADNAIARSKARGRTTPRLRACFHIGSCYEFHQAEGLNPTTYDYIVGDVTIELARMVDRALPDQVLVGEFNADLPDPSNGEDAQIKLSSIEFIGCAEQSLSKLEGLELSGDRVDAIKCYLTGSRLGDGKFSIRRIVINDKHGMTRRVYNAKVNIYRHNAQPILLGIEDHVLEAGSNVT